MGRRHNAPAAPGRHVLRDVRAREDGWVHPARLIRRRRGASPRRQEQRGDQRTGDRERADWTRSADVPRLATGVPALLVAAMTSAMMAIVPVDLQPELWVENTARAVDYYRRRSAR
jgi:hypothetical protein